jgi:hypothetical protein
VAPEPQRSCGTKTWRQSSLKFKVTGGWSRERGQGAGGSIEHGEALSDAVSELLDLLDGEILIGYAEFNMDDWLR